MLHLLVGVLLLHLLVGVHHLLLLVGVLLLIGVHNGRLLEVGIKRRILRTHHLHVEGRRAHHVLVGHVIHLNHRARRCGHGQDDALNHVLFDNRATDGTQVRHIVALVELDQSLEAPLVDTVLRVALQVEDALSRREQQGADGTAAQLVGDSES